MKKRIVSLLMVLSLIVGLLPTVAVASSSDVTYAVTGGNIYFDKATGTVTDCDKSVTVANIPEKIDGVEVTRIGDNAFSGCSSLTGVSIPRGVMSIGARAFSGCSSLTSLDIPNSVTGIGETAFSGCSNLTSVNIPSSVESIGYWAFQGCSSLTSVRIPSHACRIGSNAFDSCSSLSSITIPSSMAYISSSAFDGCSSLTDVYYSGTEAQWESIHILWYNTYLTCASIHYNSSGSGNSVDTAYALTGGNIYFDKSTGTVTGCDSTVSVANIPEEIDGVKVTTIGNSAFWYCSSLTSVSIPNGVTVIEDEAFSGCRALTNVSIPNSVTSIGWWAFGHCRGLTSVSIPSSVTEIGAYAFWYCSGLTSMNISSSVTSIGRCALMGCSGLTSISIPSSVTNIESEVFSVCSGLTSVSIPSSVTNIEHSAFEGCSSLTDVYYSGTEAQWKAVRIEHSNNYLTSATIHYNSTGPTGSSTGSGNLPSVFPPAGTSQAQYIIDRVKRYTSQDFREEYDKLTNTSNDQNYSAEIYLQKLTELFAKNGILDIYEGVDYINSTEAERTACRLLKSDMFCAQEYVTWLNDPSRSAMLRALLLADGLIFNFEISQWTDLGALAEGDYPGVKKYKDMLYDFMEKKSIDLTAMSYIKNVQKLAKGCTDVGKGYADQVIKKLSDCTTQEQVDEIVSSAEMMGIFKNSKDVIISGNTPDDMRVTYQYELDKTRGFGKFSTAMKYSATCLSIIDMAVGDVTDLMSLESKLDVYYEYQSFLQEVQSATELPLEMRMAARNILRELDEGAYGKVKQIAIDLFDASLSVVETATNISVSDTILKSVLGAAGANSISDFFATLKLAAFFVNQIVDMGSLVNGVAYVEGYVYLQNYYIKELEKAEEAFLAKGGQTEENAWRFYEVYNTLYNLRYKGEEAYLKMSKIGGLISIVSDFGYSFKEEFVQDTLNTLRTRCQFTLEEGVEVPASKQYASKMIVDCPVNVEVYAPDGTHIITLLDGAESDVSNEHGRFAVVYRSYTGEYAKVICLNQAGDYTIKITGIDKGLVSLEMAQKVGDTVKVYTFDNKEVQAGSVLQTSTEQIASAQSYRLDMDGDGEFEETGSVTIREETHVPVTALTLDQSSMELKTGESRVLNVSIAPTNATWKTVEWVSCDPSVATIKGGKVTAKAVGTTTIHCVAQDDSTIMDSCQVTVTNQTNTTPTPDTTPDTSTPTTPENPTPSTPTPSNPTPSNPSDTTPTTPSGGSTGGGSGGGGGSSTTPSKPTTPSEPSQPEAPGEWQNPFADVLPSDYFYAPVQWAVEEGITTGMSETAFMPMDVCSRAQIVTFLWRAAGEPEVAFNNGFTDVALDAYYAKAVAWAVENGITTGTSETTFSPDDPCTRAQAVTFLWRCAGEPEVESGSAFTDVIADAYYANAVAWAAEQGITTGTSASLFSPNDPCTRGQIVSFLYRDRAETA